MEQFLVDLVTNYPVGAAILMVLGVFRAIFKPLMSVWEAYVKSTPSDSDDKILEGFKASKVYKILVWLVDYLLSIKLPSKKAEEKAS